MNWNSRVHRTRAIEGHNKIGQYWKFGGRSHRVCCRRLSLLLPLLLLVIVLGAAASKPAFARYASIVMDAETGQVLHAVNADTRNYPASLTKMMTLYMTFEALERGKLSLDQRLPVSRRAQGMTPSKLYLDAGDTITVRNAILALVTKSANDAAVVLAEALGGTESNFAQKMTERARALGMTKTTFRNASGLPNRGQLSTARDMARLSRHLIYDFPQYYHYFSVEKFRYNGHSYGNHNNLLEDYSGTDGIKTGYIRASGFNLAASVVRNGRRLIAVVFGGKTARSRDAHMISLLDRGFQKVKEIRIAKTPGPPAKKPWGELDLAEASTLPDSKPLDRLIAEVAQGSVDGEVARGSAEADIMFPPPAGERPEAVTVAARRLAETEGEYAVQVGAFRSAAPAHQAATKAAKQIPQLLDSSEISVSRIRGQRGPLYRARLVGLSKPRAHQACRLLESRKVDCLVIKPTGGVEVALTADSTG